MSVWPLIERLEAQGVTLYADGGNLKYKAPKGVMTQQVLAELKENKQDILGALSELDSSIGEALTPNNEDAFEPFPLTDVQQAYWIGRSDSYDLGNIGCHIYFELEKEKIAVQRLNHAWQKVVARHPMLRAIILSDGRQRILDDVMPYVFKVYHLENKTEDEVQRTLLDVRDEMSHQVMNAETWPSFDIRVSLTNRRARLHISLDYLFADASSHLLIFNEWYHFYEHPSAPLPDLEISFRDYVMDQVRQKRTAKHRRAEKYWNDRIETLPLAPRLPLAKSPTKLDKVTFVRRTARLDTGRWEAIKKRAKAAKVTPAAVLQTAFARVLQAWAGTDEFTINLTLFRRENRHPQVNRLVGEFTSLVLLAVDLTHNETFEKQAARLQAQLVDDIDHGQVSAVQVLRALNRKRGREEDVNMPIVFTSTLGYDADGPGDLEVFKLGDLVYSITQTPQVWLDHQVTELKGELVYNWDVVEEIFPAGLMDAMFDGYKNLLQRLADDPSIWQKRYDNLLPSSQLQRRSQVNSTGAPLSDQLLHTLFEDQAFANPEAAAVISSGETLTYKTLRHRSRLVAALTQGKENLRSPLVAVMMDKGWEQVVAVLGILMAGKAYLPIDPTLPKARIDYLLADGDVQLIFTQSKFEKDFAAKEGISTISIDTLNYAQKYSYTDPGERSPDAPAYVIYTSGTTGVPKGVTIDHRGAVNTILDVNQRFGVGVDDRVLSISSLSFDLSVYDVFGTLAAGGAIVVPDVDRRTDPAHWAELVEREQVTLWNTVPALMQLFVEYLEGEGDRKAESLNWVMMSGDWIPLDLPNRIRAKADNAQLFSLGGATEASIWSILYPIGDMEPTWKSVPYGRPMLNQQFHVLNDRLAPCPDWVPGELYIGGVGVAKGYWNDEERTNKSFIIHPTTQERLYKTGDLGRYLPDGNIEFLGRNDTQVKIRGYRIELEEIESIMKQHPDVRNAVVNVIKHANKEQTIIGYYIAAPGQQPELTGFLENKLPKYMVPGQFMALKTIPLSRTGKVNRGSLPIPGDLSTSRREEGYTAPETPLEKQLCRLWANALERDRVGIHDDFFSIGGDSLTATRLVLKIRQALNVNLSLPKLFDAPSVSKLAALILDSKVTSAAVEMDLYTADDLEKEAVLDADITAKDLPPVDENRAVSKVFLTGGTGFLGAYLLKDLIESTDAVIYCLVRAASEQEGVARLKKNLEYYSLWDPSMMGRFSVVTGDLSRRRLGISKETYTYLANDIDVIYHCGAQVHFMYSYSVLKAANVNGTQEVLRLATASKLKPVHYVSTMTVFSDHGIDGTRTIEENSNISLSGVLDSGYAQSKWVAEKLIWIGESRGIPVTAYRLGLTLGDSKNGIWNADDFLFALLKGSLQVGAMPAVDVALNAIPVDFASKAIVEISRQKKRLGNVFHLDHPAPVEIGVLKTWLEQKGHAVEEVSWQAWMQRLKAYGEENAAYSLLPAFPASIEEEEEGDLVFSKEVTLKQFEAVSLHVPKIDDKLLEVYYAYFKGVGMFPEG